MRKLLLRKCRRGLALSAFGIAAMSAAYAQTPSSFDIPEQDLATALETFAKQSKVEVLFNLKQTRGKHSSPIKGELDPVTALNALLGGVDLPIRRINDSTFVIGSSPVRTGTPTTKLKDDSWSIALLAQTEGAAAFENSKNDGSAGGQYEALEEVLVTARKVSERLQDVPMSVTAISAEVLKQIGATDMKDVLRTVPGLSFTGQDRGQSTYTIRGIASGLTTTGVYFDDISLLNSDAGAGSNGGQGAADPVFFDIERLEVLKGPQGTLYGGSAMGGAIKYVSARPDLAQTSTSTAVGVASTAHGAPSYNAEAIVNLPIISDVLAVRGGVYFNREGGYIDNIAGLNVENPSISTTPSPTYTPRLQPSLGKVSKEDFNSANTLAGRVSLLWQPNEGFSVRPFVFYQEYKSDNPSAFLINNGTEDLLASSYRFTAQETSDRTTLYGLDIQKDLGGVELTSLTGYLKRKFVWSRDFSFFVDRIFSFLPFDTDSFANYPNDQNTFSQEIRLASPAASDSRLTWVAGLFFRRYETISRPKVQVWPADDPPVIGPGPFTEDALYNNLLLDGYNGLTVKDSAAFGEATYEVLDGLELTAGVRIFKTKLVSFYRDRGLAGTAPSELQNSEEDVNPKVGISYKLDRDHLVYASAAKGFRNGGPLPANFAPLCAESLEALGLDGPPTSYKSDNLWTYELGSKNGFGNDRLVLNGAVYQTDWKDIQQSIGLPSCGQTFRGNAGAARVRGAELETKISLMSAFEVGGTATYMDAKIVDAGMFSTTFTAGDDIVRAPQWMASIYGRYSTAVGSQWNMSIRGDYQYRSDSRLSYTHVQGVRYSDGVSGTVPNAFERDPSYDLANLNMSLDNGSKEFRLYVNNLFDDRPFLDSVYSVLLHSRASTLRPRTIGIEFRQQF